MACNCARNPGCSSTLLPSSPSTAIFRLHSRCGGRMSRRNEAKDSATWHVRACPQSSVMRFDNRPADRQPKPQTARFRGVERLEYALESRRREAWTRIPYLASPASLFVAAADEQFPLLCADVAHCLDGIDDQVKQYLLQLDPIALDT